MGDFWLKSKLTPYLCSPKISEFISATGGDSPGCKLKNNNMSKLHFTTKHANAATVIRNW